MNKKKLINTIVSSFSFLWLIQMVLGGVIQATVAFFVKKNLNRTKEERKN